MRLMYNTDMRKGVSGFTIVELLIVVVVIAILAAITIVSYNGIQTKATNTSIISAASNVQRMIASYIASTGEYPYAVDASYVCVTTATTCLRNSVTPIPGKNTFDNSMATIGTVPRSAPLVSSVRGGITYQYSTARTVNGTVQPAIMSYYILGINSDCGLPVLDREDATAAVRSSNKYTVGNVGSSGVTQCVVSIEGPSA